MLNKNYKIRNYRVSTGTKFLMSLVCMQVLGSSQAAYRIVVPVLDSVKKHAHSVHAVHSAHSARRYVGHISDNSVTHKFSRMRVPAHSTHSVYGDKKHDVSRLLAQHVAPKSIVERVVSTSKISAAHVGPWVLDDLCKKIDEAFEMCEVPKKLEKLEEQLEEQEDMQEVAKIEDTEETLEQLEAKLLYVLNLSLRAIEFGETPGALWQEFSRLSQLIREKELQEQESRRA